MDQVKDNRDKDWFWAKNDLIDCYGPAIGPYALAVYIVLARHADASTRQAFPAYERIAYEAGISRRQAIYAIEVLETVKLLSATKTKGRNANIYTLLSPEKRSVKEIKTAVAALKKKAKKKNNG